MPLNPKHWIFKAQNHVFHCSQSATILGELCLLWIDFISANSRDMRCERRSRLGNNAFFKKSCLGGRLHSIPFWSRQKGKRVRLRLDWQGEAAEGGEEERAGWGVWGADGGGEPARSKSLQKLQRKSLEHNNFILPSYLALVLNVLWPNPPSDTEQPAKRHSFSRRKKKSWEKERKRKEEILIAWVWFDSLLG